MYHLFERFHILDESMPLIVKQSAVFAAVCTFHEICELCTAQYRMSMRYASDDIKAPYYVLLFHNISVDHLSVFEHQRAVLSDEYQTVDGFPEIVLQRKILSAACDHSPDIRMAAHPRYEILRNFIRTAEKRPIHIDCDQFYTHLFAVLVFHQYLRIEHVFCLQL